MESRVIVDLASLQVFQGIGGPSLGLAITEGCERFPSRWGPDPGRRERFSRRTGRGPGPTRFTGSMKGDRLAWLALSRLKEFTGGITEDVRGLVPNEAGPVNGVYQRLWPHRSVEGHVEALQPLVDGG